MGQLGVEAAFRHPLVHQVTDKLAATRSNWPTTLYILKLLKLLVDVIRKVYNIGAPAGRRSGVDGGPETIIAVVGKF